MKRNIVQDVIPPKKTIRNVELLYKNKRPERKIDEIIKPNNIQINKEPINVDTIRIEQEDSETKDVSYKYEYEKPKSGYGKVAYAIIAVLLIFFGFIISTFFKSAEIKITPRNESKTITETFKAQKNLSSSGLGFQIVTTTKDVEKTVPATDTQKVEKKSVGTIVVYNNFSTQSQVLVATTRFATTDGQIFKSTKTVTVPGSQVKDGKTVAGTVDVTVEAEKAGPEYNITFKDFTIVGFKGTPKYTKIFGRAKTEMTGGFIGTQRTVSKSALDSIDKELEKSLKDGLALDIAAQIPENFVLYNSSIEYVLEPVFQTNTAPSEDTKSNLVTVKKRGAVSAIIFDKGSLSRAIIEKVLPISVNDVIKITNLGSLNFSIATGTDFDYNNGTFLNFSLRGQANFVWVVDENKLKTDLLGISKRNALTIIKSNDTIIEAGIKTDPFWNQTIPDDPKKVTILNTLTK